MIGADDFPELRLFTAGEVAQILKVNVVAVYELAAAGELEKRYIGKGTRNFRIPYGSLKRFVQGLPTEPISEDA